MDDRRDIRDKGTTKTGHGKPDGKMQNKRTNKRIANEGLHSMNSGATVMSKQKSIA